MSQIENHQEKVCIQKEIEHGDGKKRNYSVSEPGAPSLF